MLPDSASFLITEDCNLACKYCFELGHRNRRAMSKEVIHKGMELLFEGAKDSGRNEVHVTLFGGEPLLRPDLMRYLLNYGIKLADKNGARFTAGLITNATLMNDEIFDLLKEYKDKIGMSCQLSVDGIQPVHDMYRVTRNGKGSFHMIEKNIPRFKEAYADKPQLLHIHGCLNKRSMPHLFESYRFFKEEWGLNMIWFMPIHEEKWDLSDVDLYEQQLRKIKDYILKEIAETQSLQPLDDYAPLNRCFTKSKSIVPCGAGKGYVTITAQGDIYPCHHFYFNDPDGHTKLGNVFTGIDHARKLLYENYDSSDMSCPEDCEHHACYRCIACNYQVNGSPFSQVRGPYCKMQQVDLKIQREIIQEVKSLSLFAKGSSKDGVLRRPDMKDALFVESWEENGIYYERYDNKDGSSIILDAPVQSVSGKVKNSYIYKRDLEKRLEFLEQGMLTLIHEIEQLKSSRK